MHSNQKKHKDVGSTSCTSIRVRENLSNEKKSHVSITKLINVDMNPHQATLCFNVCILMSAFFGSGIAFLTDAQEK